MFGVFAKSDIKAIDFKVLGGPDKGLWFVDYPASYIAS